jgi:hypothetical protein
MVLTAATSYAAFQAVTLAHSIVGELDRAAAITDLAPRPQATIVFDRAGRSAKRKRRSRRASRRS